MSDPSNPFASMGPPRSATGEPVDIGPTYVSHGEAPPPGAYNEPPPRRSASTITLLVLAVLATIPGLLLPLPSAILAMLALSRHRDAPDSARRLTRIGWVILVISAGVAAALWLWIRDRLGGAPPSDGLTI